MRPDDRVRLRHMVDAAREAIDSAAARKREDLETDHVWALGLVKCVEIIGEAASRLEEDTRDLCPEIPWAAIVGMRNRLVHAYFDVDLEQVWKTVTSDLPALLPSFEKMLEE
jgi:uncharacterized protein with HEPN domain